MSNDTKKSTPLWAKVLVAWIFTPIGFQVLLVVTGVSLDNNLENNISAGLTLAAITGVVVEHDIRRRGEK
ncbi:hypothetical protein [Nostoc sp. MS1]|uniref:hypothetical protein n=1 Tax=Nostoc sp. MS1 TaxID=2764711 RepID=UPI001CC7F707|nr:hypothetical protein [Nostoc sp. MS1]BCL34580.1 hypothetical protein NSMS1_10270 [Nostoc sp. MS1]